MIIQSSRSKNKKIKAIKKKWIEKENREKKYDVYPHSKVELEFLSHFSVLDNK